MDEKNLIYNNLEKIENILALMFLLAVPTIVFLVITLVIFFPEVSIQISQDLNEGLTFVAKGLFGDK